MFWPVSVCVILCKVSIFSSILIFVWGFCQLFNNVEIVGYAHFCAFISYGL